MYSSDHNPEHAVHAEHMDPMAVDTSGHQVFFKLWTCLMLRTFTTRGVERWMVGGQSRHRHCGHSFMDHGRSSGISCVSG